MLLLADTVLLGWHVMHVITSASDRLAQFQIIVLGLVFAWVLACVTLNLVATVAADRRRNRDDDPPLDLVAFHGREADDRLLIMVPSYREEEATIWQTLMSAALAEHPARDVVLLIDDPEARTGSDHAILLQNARALPARLQAQFDTAAAPFAAARDAYAGRRDRFERAEERARLVAHYEAAADWLEREADAFLDLTHAHQSHTDRLFAEKILREPARKLRRHAVALETRNLTPADAADEYNRLSNLFRVRFSRFERKQYVNLSHAPNKAMNLNTYMSLIGKAFRSVETDRGLELLPSCVPTADIVVPHYPFIVAIDADSMITNDYAARLLPVMRAPDGERVAIAQSPYTAIPDAPNLLERAAAASTDGQYYVHQGLAALGATSWVGAAALIRFAAMVDIKTVRVEGDREVDVYIKDDILIEDAAATIDLLRRGWRIHHTDRRLTFSATPPDFGSLIIQRRRWANGGLLLLPRLLDIMRRQPAGLAAQAQALVRVPHLTSAATNGLFFLLMVLVPFRDEVLPCWMVAMILPSLLLTAHDLVRAGYRLGDLVPVQALSILLVPVNLAGSWQSLRQALDGAPVPFARTPKIGGRTRTPLAYLCAVQGLMLYAAVVAGVDVAARLYTHAAFATFNVVALAYCMIRLIGLRHAWDDLRVRFGARRAMRPATLVTRG